MVFVGPSGCGKMTRGVANTLTGITAERLVAEVPSISQVLPPPRERFGTASAPPSPSPEGKVGAGSGGPYALGESGEDRGRYAGAGPGNDLRPAKPVDVYPESPGKLAAAVIHLEDTACYRCTVVRHELANGLTVIR